jgi:hypothetical protein
MAGQAGRSAAPPADPLDLRCPPRSARRHNPGCERTPAETTPAVSPASHRTFRPGHGHGHADEEGSAHPHGSASERSPGQQGSLASADDDHQGDNQAAARNERQHQDQEQRRSRQGPARHRAERGQDGSTPMAAFPLAPANRPSRLRRDAPQTSAEKQVHRQGKKALRAHSLTGTGASKGAGQTRLRYRNAKSAG